MAILAEFAEGRLTSDLSSAGSDELVYPWEMTCKSWVAFEGKMQSLSSLIKDKKLQSVYLHEAFAEGVPPKELKPRASSWAA